jgi:hypothetical protein
MRRFGKPALALLVLSSIGVIALAYGLSGAQVPNAFGQGSIAPASRYQSSQINETDVKIGPTPRVEAADKGKSRSAAATKRKQLSAAVDKGVAKSVAAEGIRLSNGRSALGHQNEALLGYGTVVAVTLRR